MAQLPHPCPGIGFVEILPPEEEFDSMITSGHIRFDAVNLMQFLKQVRVDHICVDFGAGNFKHWVDNQVDESLGILIITP